MAVRGSGGERLGLSKRSGEGCRRWQCRFSEVGKKKTKAARNSPSIKKKVRANRSLLAESCHIVRFAVSIIAAEQMPII